MGIDLALEQVLTDEDRQIRRQLDQALAAAKYRPVISNRLSFAEKPYELGCKADAVAAIDVFVENTRYIYRNPTCTDIPQVYLGQTTLIVDRYGIKRELEAELERRGYKGISVSTHLDVHYEKAWGRIVDNYYYLVARFTGVSGER